MERHFHEIQTNMNVPKKHLRRDTRAYISAVTRELGSVRKLVKKALEDNDYHAVEQDNFPPLPPPNEDGNYPALENIRVSIARDIVRQRQALGLSQQALAKLAGAPPQTLLQLESGQHSPTVRTVEKIDRALKLAAQRSGSRRDRDASRKPGK
jgi:ribosome-binding protein aMBF1 (putative translation factor)